MDPYQLVHAELHYPDAFQLYWASSGITGTQK